MKILGYLLTNALAVMVSAYILPGVRVESAFVAVVVGVFLGLANLIIRPILLFLTFPLTIMTFGLFTLVINGLMVLLVARVVPGFAVSGLGWAILFSLVMSFVSSLFNWINKG